MILYFTGTSNSRFVAEKLAKYIDDSLLCLNERIKNNDCSDVLSGENLIVVTPTYAWRIPRTVTEWIEKTNFVNVKRVWFVMTCGGEVGNASKYNKKLAELKGFEYMGTAQIVMPENYIAMFSTPEKQEAVDIVSKAKPLIDRISNYIITGEKFEPINAGVYYRFLSSVVNKVFYPVCVNAKKFYVTDACISCGKCEKVCPLNNIKLLGGKPHWDNNCTHCMACISYCPKSAIEYGKNSVEKRRYTFEGLNLE